MPTASQIQLAVNRLPVDSQKLHDIVHGDANTVVTTDNGPVKSIANLQRKFALDAGDVIDQATALKNSAQGFRNEAEGFKNTASSAAVAAALAADSALALSNLYPSTSAGLAAAAEGAYFAVAGTGSTYATLYRKVSGAATVIGAYPSKAALDSVVSGLSAADGSTRVGFIQTGSGAVTRTAQDKARESVSLEDFYSGNFADALEAASAVASVVNIYGAAYQIGRIATVAADTRIVLHGTTLSRASGNTATHMLTFAGSGEIAGYGTFNGTGMTAPSASWVGSGVPQGSCIYAAGANIGSRTATVKIGGRIKFTGFPSGAVFCKWLKLLDIDSVELSGCQTATLQYKASGSYANVPTTNTLAAELITSAGLEAFQCETVRVRNSVIPAISKGVSLSADNVIARNNTYTFGSTRHAQEHITSSGRVVRLGSTYDGGADKGDAYKVVNCANVSGGFCVIENATYGGYIQDSDNIAIANETMSGIVNSAYGFATNTGGRAMTNVSIQLGSISGAGGSGSRAIYIATDATAVAAGYSMKLSLKGGSVKGFEGLINHATSGLGMTLDLSWKGTEVAGTTQPADLRVRNADVDLTFIGCTAPLIDVGNVSNVANGTIVAGKSVAVRLRALNCSGAGSALMRHASAAALSGAFERADFDIASSGGTVTYALSFSLAGSNDSLELLNVNIDCPDLDPSSAGGGQAWSFDAAGKAFKARMRITALGLGNYTPLNVTITNGSSVTGVYEKPIAGVLTGGALTAV